MPTEQEMQDALAELTLESKRLEDEHKERMSVLRSRIKAAEVAIIKAVLPQVPFDDDGRIKTETFCLSAVQISKRGWRITLTTEQNGWRWRDKPHLADEAALPSQAFELLRERAIHARRSKGHGARTAARFLAWLESL